VRTPAIHSWTSRSTTPEIGERGGGDETQSNNNDDDDDDDDDDNNTRTRRSCPRPPQSHFDVLRWMYFCCENFVFCANVAQLPATAATISVLDAPPDHSSRMSLVSPG
jgi:hypothetical protein